MMNTADMCMQVKPLSPTEQVRHLQHQIERASERTEIEEVAGKVTNLVDNIQRERSNLKNLAVEQKSAEARLSTYLLEHQIAVAKFKELGAIPQPTA